MPVYVALECDLKWHPVYIRKPDSDSQLWILKSIS
jgi:hypothetical protein